MKAFIFDCFGVLFSSGFESIMQQCPLQNQNDLLDIDHQFCYGYIGAEEYEFQIAQLLGWSQKKTSEALWQKRTRNNTLFEYIEKIHKSPMKTAILSNVGVDTLDRLFQPGEMERLFDAQFLSYREGIAKPNPEAFTLVAERLGVSADACVMIDDHAENCEGAEVAGMKAIQHTNNLLTIERLEAFRNNA